MTRQELCRKLLEMEEEMRESKCCDMSEQWEWANVLRDMRLFLEDNEPRH